MTTTRVTNLLSRLRNRHFLLADILVLLGSPTVALLLRLDGLVGSLHLFYLNLIVYTLFALVVRLAIFYRFDFYRRYWRYASIDELVLLTVGNLVATLVVCLLFFGVRWPPLGLCDAVTWSCRLPRSLPFLDGLVVFLAVSAVRFGVRLLELVRRRRRPGGHSTQRILIAGAGEAGVTIAREIRSNPALGLDLVGFLDDDPSKQDMRIQGAPVLGRLESLPEIVGEVHVQQVVIAMPTAPGKTIRRVVELCETARVIPRTIPSLASLLDANVSVSQLRKVEIEDLLRRDPVHTDTAAVMEMLRGKRVLVTGGGGSIGSEVCRQLLRCHPAELVILGHGENSVFEIAQELGRTLGNSKNGKEGSPRLRTVIADIRFRDRIQAVFAEVRPQVVFHAAAHKHVPLMEDNPAEAVTNNILGTQNVIEAAAAAGVHHFVMISTDKAVNPTSVMGVSKRVAELILHQTAVATGRPYVAVRFGNVLGSRGSVVLTFKRQIAAGGPVTVTHPEMKRYFMTIPEAVQLVLQAATLGKGGEVFVLDMGEPIKIVDLARDLIELSGLRVGRDIDLTFTGLRPGEKLFEELFVSGETYERTRHDKIFVAGNASSAVPADLNEGLAVLGAAAQRGDRGAILRALQALVPEYMPGGYLADDLTSTSQAQALPPPPRQPDTRSLGAALSGS